jgi:multiple sugar transport system substrate-binding protein
MRKIVIGVVAICLIGLISTGAWSQEKELIYGFPSAEEEAILKAGVSPEREAYLKTKPYKGVTVTVTVNTAGREGPISGPLYLFGELWEQQTGGKVEVIEIPYAEHFEKVWIDLSTGAGKYDSAMTGAFWLGDLIAYDYIEPLDKYMKDPRFPQWKTDTVSPALKTLRTWAGKWYVVPNDADGQVLYYRKDIMTDPDYKRRFWEKYGYELPVPPATWDELQDIAEFFNGWDWDNDGTVDYGIAMHLKVGGQGMFHFESLSAPFVINPSNTRLWWFDPETMEPSITSPGHLEALKTLIELSKQGPRAALSWSLGEAWDCFLRGDAAMTFSWGDVGSLVQDVTKSKIKGKMGCAPLPGTLKSYDPVGKKWIEYKRPNIVGNTTGGSWAGAVFKQSKHPEATYDFLAFMATQAANMWNATRGWTGVDPGRTFVFIDPYGPATTEEYVKRGWDAGDAAEYSKGYYKNFYNPLMYPYLRIPGSVSYHNTLDVYLSEAVTGTLSPEEALKRIYEEWEETTDQLGREEQIRLYQESIGY